MKDAEQQNGQAADFPANSLTDRLLRRATAPIGVIDVRHAHELHARAGFRQEAKSALVDNLRNRYLPSQSDGHPARAGSFPYVDIASVSRSIAGEFSMPTAPPFTPAVEREHPASAVSSELPSVQQYRVRRPGNPPGPASSTTISPEGFAPPPSAGEIRVSTSSAPVIHVQRKIVDNPEPVAMTLQRPDPQVPPVSSGEGRAQGVSDAAGVLPRVSELPQGAKNEPMHFERMKDNSQATKEASLISTRHVRTEPIRESLPDKQSLPLISPASSGPQISRKPMEDVVAGARYGSPVLDAMLEPHETAKPAPPVAPTSELPSIRHSTRATVSAEIPAAPLLTTFSSMVWRKPDTNGGRPEAAATASAVGPVHTSMPQIMRETASEPVSSGSAGSASLPGPGNGADLAQIAEQVNRIIARQFRVERERRGKTR